MSTPMKTCTQCGTESEATLAFFYKFKSPDGLYPRCKTCYKPARGSKTSSMVALVTGKAKAKPADDLAKVRAANIAKSNDLMKAALARTTRTSPRPSSSQPRSGIRSLCAPSRRGPPTSTDPQPSKKPPPGLIR